MSKELMKRLYYYSAFDGGLYVRKDLKNAFFAMNMLRANIDYVEKVQEALTDADIGSKIYDRTDYNTDGCVRQPQVRLQSKTHPKLTTIRDRIYLEGRKVIDPHMLTMLDAEALAIIFMADGSRVQDKRCDAAPTYTLNTKGYSYGDNWLLKKAIKEVLDIEFNVQRQNQYWYLRLRAADAAKFETTVDEFVLNSFSYKLGR